LQTGQQEQNRRPDAHKRNALFTGPKNMKYGTPDGIAEECGARFSRRQEMASPEGIQPNNRHQLEEVHGDEQLGWRTLVNGLCLTFPSRTAIARAAWSNSFWSA
jgi:hypothetical protein